MEKVPIFIASSIQEFKVERNRISVYLDMLNDVHERDGVALVWKRPETMSEAYYLGGMQRQYDKEITKSRFFILIVGKKLGEHTEAEFELALRCYQKTGAPKLLFYFLDVFPDMDVQNFRERLRNLEGQYVNVYGNFDQILNKLHIELIRHGAFDAQGEAFGMEETARQGQDAARKLIRAQQDKIKELKAQDVTPEIVAERTQAYEEIWRLVRKYKVEPNALLDYMSFLDDQHLYDTGIEVGRWLEGFYSMDAPDDDTLSLLKNRLGVCYKNSNQYEQAERYYREELKIEEYLAEKNPARKFRVAATYGNLGNLFWRTNRMKEAETYCKKALKIYRGLAKENPAAFESYVAKIRNNLGNLFLKTGQMKKAENYYREALKIQRRLARDNPATFEPYMATTCYNLGILFSETNQPEKAERNYRKALEIRRRLAKDNPAAFEPYIARTCNNLGCLYAALRQREKAERLFQEALEIFRRLAKNNPATFEPDLAETCHSMGEFERDRGNRDAARRYFEKALSLNENFSHRAKNARMCRNELAKL